jgi:hypothetical protein
MKPASPARHRWTLARVAFAVPCATPWSFGNVGEVCGCGRVSIPQPMAGCLASFWLAQFATESE